MIGSISSFNGNEIDAASVQADKVQEIADELLVVASVVGRCFDAFPLIKEEMKRSRIPVNESLFNDIAKMAQKFNETSEGISDDLMLDADEAKVKSALNALKEWKQKLYAAVKAVFSDVPDPKPQPAPKPASGGATGDYIVHVCANCDKLNAELATERENCSKLKERVKTLIAGKKAVEDENAMLKAKIADMEKPKPAPPRPEPKILNTEIEFEPKKFTRKGKEEILFFVMKGYYKHYYIAKDCADKLKLDKTKPVKLVVESFETHCHTDEEEETKIAEEYYVPKGEDFFICRGKIAA